MKREICSRVILIVVQSKGKMEGFLPKSHTYEPFHATNYSKRLEKKVTYKACELQYVFILKSGQTLNLSLTNPKLQLEINNFNILFYQEGSLARTSTNS